MNPAQIHAALILAIFVLGILGIAAAIGAPCKGVGKCVCTSPTSDNWSADPNTINVICVNQATMQTVYYRRHKTSK